MKAAMSSPVSPGLQSGRAAAQSGKDKTGGASAGISRCMAPGVSRAQEQAQRSIETALRRVHGQQKPVEDKLGPEVLLVPNFYARSHSPAYLRAAVPLMSLIS